MMYLQRHPSSSFRIPKIGAEVGSCMGAPAAAIALYIGAYLETTGSSCQRPAFDLREHKTCSRHLKAKNPWIMILIVINRV